MKRENVCRFLFVATACLLSVPWLTPCAGVMVAAAVDDAHNSVSKRDVPLSKLPTQQLKTWAAKPGPKFRVDRTASIPASLLISDAEVSKARGGHDGPRPGSAVGNGASALVDGVTETLLWIDPLTWIASSSMGMDRDASKAQQQIVLCESPFVVLQGRHMRLVREGTNGTLRLVKARDATVTIITAEGSYSGSAGFIHFRGPSQEVILENACRLKSGTQYFSGTHEKNGPLMKLNFVKRTVSCQGAVGEGVFE